MEQTLPFYHYYMVYFLFYDVHDYNTTQLGYCLWCCRWKAGFSIDSSNNTSLKQIFKNDFFSYFKFYFNIHSHLFPLFCSHDIISITRILTDSYIFVVKNVHTK